MNKASSWLIGVITFGFTLLVPCGAAANPVVRGDYPDPGIARVGKQFWLATSERYRGSKGVFPLFRSSNLYNWKRAGSAFRKPPRGTNGSYWAPEYFRYGKRTYMFYTARYRDKLCIASSEVTRPYGYRDRGVLLCHNRGAIDPFVIRSSGGKVWLVWKSQRNSKMDPSRIWMQRVSINRNSVLGRRIKVMTASPQGWESGVIEAPSLFRRGGYWYMVYSGSDCCGVNCSYGVGAARSRHLTRGWERYPGNPILRGDGAWKCPGHGSLMAVGGEDYYVYHAYNSTFRKRSLLLDRIRWVNGWPTIGNGFPARSAPRPLVG